MQKKAFFFIDDVIWVFRDLTRERPASLFDNPFMKCLKEAHDRYGMKVQLHAFYRTDFFYGNDEFTLAEMTDADFHIKGTWKTENDNTLYEITDEGNKKHTETIKYVFSNDGSSVNFSISDGAGGKTTMILKKA